MSRDPQKTASSLSRQHARNLAVVCAVLSALGLGSARFQRARKKRALPKGASVEDSPERFRGLPRV
jgi:hypothetical protein